MARKESSMSKPDAEILRSIGSTLEDVREHVTVVKGELEEIELNFEKALGQLAGLLARKPGN